jgi:hypothetical protein
MNNENGTNNNADKNGYQWSCGDWQWQHGLCFYFSDADIKIQVEAYEAAFLTLSPLARYFLLRRQKKVSKARKCRKHFLTAKGWPEG